MPGSIEKIIVHYDNNGDDSKREQDAKRQAREILSRIKRAVSINPNIIIGLTYSANSGQTWDIQKDIRDGEVGFPEITGGAQANVLTHLRTLIYEEAENQHLRGHLRIIPITTMLGHSTYAGNIVAYSKSDNIHDQDHVTRDITNVRNFINEENHHLMIWGNQDNEYAIGGYNAGPASPKIEWARAQLASLYHNCLNKVTDNQGSHRVENGGSNQVVQSQEHPVHRRPRNVAEVRDCPVVKGRRKRVMGDNASVSFDPEEKMLEEEDPLITAGDRDPFIIALEDSHKKNGGLWDNRDAVNPVDEVRALMENYESKAEKNNGAQQKREALHHYMENTLDKSSPFYHSFKELEDDEIAEELQFYEIEGFKKEYNI